MFKTDDHYLIGGMHVREGKPCQDHALSGMFGDVAFAIVSDGCSSGGLTDVGARLVSLTMASSIDNARLRESDFVPEALVSEHIKKLRAIANELPVTSDDLLATCAFAVMTPVGGFAHVRGDGVIAVKMKDGSILLTRFDWADNMPFYPAYSLGREREFVTAHGGDENAPRLTDETWVFRSGEGFRRVGTTSYTVMQGMQGLITPMPDIDKMSFVAVFSDGVTQVDGIDWKDAVVELLAFKGVEGVFAKRRMIRFDKDARKRGQGPQDDIAFAVIHVEREAVEKQYDSDSGHG